MISAVHEQLLGWWYRGGPGTAQSAMGPMLDRLDLYAGELEKCPHCSGRASIGGASKARARKIISQDLEVAERANDAAEVERLAEIARLTESQSHDDASGSTFCPACEGTGWYIRRGEHNVIEGKRKRRRAGGDVTVQLTEEPSVKRHTSWFGATASCRTCNGAGCVYCGELGYGNLDPVGHSSATTAGGKRPRELMSDKDLERMALVTSLLALVTEIDPEVPPLLEWHLGDAGSYCAEKCKKRGRDVALYQHTDSGKLLLALDEAASREKRTQGEEEKELTPLDRMVVLAILDEMQDTNRALLDAAHDEARALVWRMSDVWERAVDEYRGERVQAEINDRTLRGSSAPQ